MNPIIAAVNEAIKQSQRGDGVPLSFLFRESLGLQR